MDQDEGGAGTRGFEEAIDAWDGSGVVVRYDRPSGGWFFVALHDSTLGTPTGGCRLRVYRRPADGLVDALRLARGMTFKWAAIDFPFGGGKSVLAVPEVPTGEARRELFRRYGRLLEELRGAYQSGEDLGTTPTDMALVATETSHILGIVEDPGGRGPVPVDPGPYTARGVLASIRAGLEHLSGSSDLQGRTILVQGVGDVGEPLARMIREAGGTPVLADPDHDRVIRVADELGARFVPPEDAYGAEVDVFSPCAVGAVLNPGSIGLLQCRLIAGSANNQLRDDSDAGLLEERRILYVPDFVANAGGAIAFGMLADGSTEGEIEARVEAIGGTVREILTEAAEREQSPLAAAHRRAERTLERAREARRGPGGRAR